MKNIIEVLNIEKEYPLKDESVKVLRGVSFNIEDGDFVAIMGPSGSGKSTLLHTLSGLDRPTAGKSLVAGKQINSLNDEEISRFRRTTLGFIFQSYNLIENLTVEENILFPLLLDGKKKKKMMGKLNRILEDVGLTDRRHHKPRELSGGQQQRTAIARALIIEPEVLFADEPIGNLDSKTGDGIIDMLNEINKKYNMSIVMVTHDLNSVRHCHRIVHILDGNIDQIEVKSPIRTING